MPVIHLINATLDGRCDHRNVVADDDLHAHALETIADADAILFGSGTYRLLAPYWSQAAKDASSTPVINEFARVFAAKPKILFSASAEPWLVDVLRLLLQPQVGGSGPVLFEPDEHYELVLRTIRTTDGGAAALDSGFAHQVG